MASGHDYSLFGLALRSEIELPELMPAAPGHGPDVVIRLGATVVEGEDRPGFNPTAWGALLNVPDVGRFAIRQGREIVVEGAPGASPQNKRLYLLGSAMGALLHQRGLLPLHANAVVLKGRAIAFCGHSGAGKSTIAAWFHDRGDAILADDVCALASAGGDEVVAFPGVPRLRLWRDALEKGGRDAADYRRSFDSLDKWDVPTRHSSSASPVPLAKIYVLGRTTAEAEGPVIRRLAGIDAVNALVANTYRGRYVRLAGLTGEHLATCLAIARAVPIFEAARAWDLEAFDRDAALLREHACAD